MVQEQLTALSQKYLDSADFPEQVVHHIEQDLAEVISRLDRQVAHYPSLITSPTYAGLNHSLAYSAVST